MKTLLRGLGSKKIIKARDILVVTTTLLIQGVGCSTTLQKIEQVAAMLLIEEYGNNQAINMEQHC